MQQIANTLETELQKYGLQINMKKTELLQQEMTDTRESLYGYEGRLQKLGITPDLEGHTTALPRCRPGQRATEILMYLDYRRGRAIINKVAEENKTRRIE
jgi:hypothetical protein